MLRQLAVQNYDAFKHIYSECDKDEEYQQISIEDKSIEKETPENQELMNIDDQLI